MIAPPQAKARPTWLPESEFPFQSRFLELDGHEIHYIDEGTGPTLLFVHAGPAWIFVYRDVITRLRDEFRCVALDFPNSGLSHAADGYRPGLQTASGVLDAFVRTLDLREITLVVHDLGGPIAVGVAARHPDRFLAIAATEAFGWVLSEENPRVARMLRFMGSRPFRLINNAANLLARGMTTSMGLGSHFSSQGKTAFRGPYRDRRVRNAALDMLCDAATANEYLRDVNNALRTSLKDMPLLLVFGARSPTIKEGFLDRWTAMFPNARVLVLDNARHFPMADEPEAVAAAIRAWSRDTLATRQAMAT